MEKLPLEVLKNLDISRTYLENAYRYMENLNNTDRTFQTSKLHEIYNFGEDRIKLNLIRLSNVKKVFEKILGNAKFD